jgi:hypothetical protein
MNVETRILGIHRPQAIEDPSGYLTPFSFEAFLTCIEDREVRKEVMLKLSHAFN